jgi:hypothetical protein
LEREETRKEKRRQKETVGKRRDDNRKEKRRDKGSLVWCKGAGCGSGGVEEQAKIRVKYVAAGVIKQSPGSRLHRGRQVYSLPVLSKAARPDDKTSLDA